MFKPLLMALQLLTRLPVAVKLDEQDDAARLAGQSVLYYPLVGLFIGSILYLVLLLLSLTALGENSLLTAALLLVLWVLLTGALHLDGLADSADAWLGGYGDKDKTLAIMKDPYCGPAGVVSIVLILLLKFTALTSLLVTVNWSIILVPLLARAAVIALFCSTPYVRKGGMGEQAASTLPVSNAIVVLVVIVILTVLLLGFTGVAVLLVLGMTLLLLRYIMLRRIGGTTGDTAGASVEISETVVLLSLIV